MKVKPTDTVFEACADMLRENRRNAVSVPLAPDEVLAQVLPVRNLNYEVPLKPRSQFSSSSPLPSSELLQALHYYASSKIREREDSERMTQCCDETFLLAMGVIVQQYMEELVTQGGKEPLCKLYLEYDNSEDSDKQKFTAIANKRMKTREYRVIKTVLNHKEVNTTYKLLVQFEDGSSDWVPLIDAQRANHVMVAQYLDKNIKPTCVPDSDEQIGTSFSVTNFKRIIGHKAFTGKYRLKIEYIDGSQKWVMASVLRSAHFDEAIRDYFGNLDRIKDLQVKGDYKKTDNYKLKTITAIVDDMKTRRGHLVEVEFADGGKQWVPFSYVKTNVDYRLVKAYAVKHGLEQYLSSKKYGKTKQTVDKQKRIVAIVDHRACTGGYTLQVQYEDGTKSWVRRQFLQWQGQNELVMEYASRHPDIVMNNRIECILEHEFNGLTYIFKARFIGGAEKWLTFAQLKCRRKDKALLKSYLDEHSSIKRV